MKEVEIRYKGTAGFVLVPTYNEESEDKLIKQLDDICDDAEIVIVDGRHGLSH